MKEIMFELDDKLARPDFKRITDEIRNLLNEAGHKGDKELEQKLLRLLSIIDEELKKNEDFKTLLYFMANKF